MKIRISDESGFCLWKQYNKHLERGNRIRAAMYKFILSNTYAKEV